MMTLTRRAIFLDACGVGPLWVRRHIDGTDPTEQPDLRMPDLAQASVATVIAPAPAPALVTAEDSSIVVTALNKTPSPPQPLSVETAPMESNEKNELMSAWEESSLPTSVTSFIRPDLAAAKSPTSRLLPTSPNIIADSDTVLADIAGMDWRQLKAAVSECTRCGLCHSREHTVFGAGDERAKWLFIGEGPGQAEDQDGEPFVGPAGQLLDNMLAAIGVRRGENAYIANIVKCRPIDVEGDAGRDRSPSAEEVAACLPYLQRQIALIQPTVLVALGKTAALSLLALDASTLVASLRGTVHRYAGLPLVVTYHPAYLLRKPADKAKAWSDLCLALTCHAAILE
ncbi:uracil-DNA glycosylase family protein [Glaciimonas sp. PAMC28666]|uniref:uracil-DNA glycosylase n=1 Tax=Glaciimonas sp. PAMC28666 TaxID=2807626 RepID=UPI001963F4AF|nr:uracil-DNA glycosylase [Glaciimonas sp. PAMC28666]QRX82878.1 uracil-DNA glycosylase [Glaciimonas sp. PAMC28666]